jgi:hypothetical protein
MSKLPEKPSALKKEPPALQKMKFITFFLCLWVIFARLDPDLDCEYGSGSRDPVESGCRALLTPVLTYRTAYNKSPTERMSLNQRIGINKINPNI